MMLLHVTYLGHLFFSHHFTYPTKSSITPPTPHVSQPPQITHKIIPNHHKTPLTATIGHYIHSPHHHIITKPHITPSSFQPSKPQFLYQLTIFLVLGNYTLLIQSVVASVVGLFLVLQGVGFV
jgi:hypothetical protein